ncbi:MAG TPA: MarR family transcriptional regulator [Trebonia sp.]|jgi:DNA-binding MarR family transcriptional regulator
MDMIESLSAWVAKAEERRETGFGDYVTSIAEARYVMRKVSRIVDDEAKGEGLDPLEHQAMLQAYGAGPRLRTVSQIAERLDIAPALASRVVNGLVRKGMVVRRSSAADKRVTEIEISDDGAELIRKIDRKVHVHMDYFQNQLTESQRLEALAIFSFYLGFANPTPELVSSFVAFGTATS